MIYVVIVTVFLQNFSLSDSSAYKDDNKKFMNKYLQQNNLVVKGGFHHTEDNSSSEEDRIKVFALLRLER